MDPRERLAELEEIVRSALDARQVEIWTSMPGIIESFDPVEQTASVNLAITSQQRNSSGALVSAQYPKLIHCPVKFPNGGGCSLTFPISQGDECTVHFSARAIDSWWQQGGIQAPIEFRIHDLSDGFVDVGPRSKPRVISNISTTSTQLRSDDGSTFVDLDPTAKTLTLTAPNGATVNANVLINGDLHVTGEIKAGFGGADQVGVQSHTHPDPQGGNTGVPNPGT